MKGHIVAATIDVPGSESYLGILRDIDADVAILDLLMMKNYNKMSSNIPQAFRCVFRYSRIYTPTDSELQTAIDRYDLLHDYLPFTDKNDRDKKYKQLFELAYNFNNPENRPVA
jgi:hypothetical protein